MILRWRYGKIQLIKGKCNNRIIAYRVSSNRYGARRNIPLFDLYPRYCLEVEDYEKYSNTETKLECLVFTAYRAYMWNRVRLFQTQLPEEHLRECRCIE